MGLPLRKGGHYRVLVVESDHRAFDELRQGITGLGPECEVALDLETALAVLSERMMDMVVVNAGLAECTDAELLDRLSAGRRSMRVVVYAGKAPVEERRRLRRSGADSYLGPDKDLRAVLAAIARVLDRDGYAGWPCGEM
jgi:DNA-binding response OmpR family regulator